MSSMHVVIKRLLKGVAVFFFFGGGGGGGGRLIFIYLYITLYSHCFFLLFFQ